MAQEDEVMDGHHALDARLAKSCRQFARQPVEELYAVGHEVADDAPTAPPRLEHAVFGIAEVDVRLDDDLLSELVVPFVGGIEAQVKTVGTCRGEVVDQRAAVAAQSCGIAYDAFCVESYCHSPSHNV